MYSTYEEECEANPSTDREKIMVLGGGPNRIGQGIEFDYCCVHASLALREDGYETIMVNCNPETVSTDYDTSDRLYFEPVTLEDVLEIVRIEKPKGVIVQYGGQTPLKLARALEAAGVPVIGTSPDAIDRAEDRERFQHAVDRLKLKQPANATVTAIEMAVEKAKEIGYPLVVPILFYQGEATPYPLSMCWFDMFYSPELARRVYNSPFPLVDITITPDDEIMQHRRIAILELLQKHIRQRDLMLLLEQLVTLIDEGYTSGSQLVAMQNYMLQRGHTEQADMFYGVFRDRETGGESMMTLAQWFEEKG
eukprot:341485_1